MFGYYGLDLASINHNVLKGMVLGGFGRFIGKQNRKWPKKAHKKLWNILVY